MEFLFGWERLTSYDASKPRPVSVNGQCHIYSSGVHIAKNASAKRQKRSLEGETAERTEEVGSDDDSDSESEDGSELEDTDENLVHQPHRSALRYCAPDR